MSPQKRVMLNLKAARACMPLNHNKIKRGRYFPGIFPICQTRNKNVCKYVIALTVQRLISAAIFNDLCSGNKK